MKKIAALLITGLVSFPLYAETPEQQAAEQLVAGKEKADMSYRQLMEILGTASGMIHEGVIRQNKHMVKSGADIVLNHPAPNHKPWTIMAAEDQAGFKQSLLTFDKILDDYALKAVEAADKDDWPGAATASSDLTNSCIACHAMWKGKVR